MTLNDLFSVCSPSVVCFISRLSIGAPGSAPPHFPPIIGTGFVVSSDGLIATNRHVVEAFEEVPRHPKTGKFSVDAIGFFPGDEAGSWQMLALGVIATVALSSMTSSDTWHGSGVPDIAFVQVGVRDLPVLKLATEDFYMKIGMSIATIGYPMGTTPLTALDTLNQVTPFIRHGVVSSVFPFPIAKPHGFTIDIMQQGGSSGSPIFRVEDGAVIGMMSSGVLDLREAKSTNASLTYALNTNISICEPAHIIKMALDEMIQKQPRSTRMLPTLKEQRAKYPMPPSDSGMSWDSFLKSE